MLTLLAFGMVTTFMTLIMTKRLSALVALIVVPMIFGLLAGFAPALGGMMLDGVRALAPTGVMILFAILYFGVMIDAGLFDPLITRIVRLAGGDPVRINVGTAVLALLVSLDGDGTTTYMICVSAVMPLYLHLKLDLRKMACLIMMAAAITNIVPWGGPTARVATALKLDPSEIFVAMVPGLLVCVGWLLLIAYFFGISERNRLRACTDRGVPSEPVTIALLVKDRTRDPATLRPRRFLANLLLTAALLTILMLGTIPLPVTFMVALAVALLLNYPSLREQKERIDAHAGNALAVVSLIFAAGIFTGILSGTKMLDAMAAWVVDNIPVAAGPYLAPLTAVLSIPFTFFISNDAFYFGVVPILAETAAAYGVSAKAIACASLVGQQVHLLSPLVPSTYLLVGMANIELGAHQRFTLPWALASCLLLLVCCVLFGTFPLGA